MSSLRRCCFSSQVFQFSIFSAAVIVGTLIRNWTKLWIGGVIAASLHKDEIVPGKCSEDGVKSKTRLEWKNKTEVCAEFRARQVYAILACMNEQDWIAQIKARGLGGVFGAFLDVIEPLGPLGAQLLWVAQPAMSMFGLGEALGRIAHTLEEPGGIERLRQAFDDEH